MVRTVDLVCNNCSVHFVNEYKKRFAKFCSKGCATSFRQDARDPNFLEEMNELSAYLIGFILTDGSISQQKGKKERITLANTDFEIMSKLHPIISPRRKLYTREMKKKEHKTAYSLVNTNVDAISTLKKLGIDSDKTFNVRLPNLPTELYRHFVRGVLDGDGSISNYRVRDKYTYKKLGFTSASKMFSLEFKQLLEQQGFSPLIRKDDRHNAYYVVMNKTQEIKDFARWIYEDSNWYIARKKNIFFDDIV